ncbi:MAG TPA: signal peptidase II [Fimbriimonadales bacterium]|nr:signal peptidase II [Fimbriimonadales bacterium]
MKIKMALKLARFILVVAIFLALDQITKSAIRTNLVPGQSLVVIPGIFELTLVYNTGIAFGLFPNAGIWLAPTAVLVSIAATFGYLYAPPNFRLFSASMMLVTAGAIGNFTDRIFHEGRVTDFIDIKIIHVFNLADFYITLAVVLLFVHWIFVAKHDLATPSAERENEKKETIPPREETESLR